MRLSVPSAALGEESANASAPTSKDSRTSVLLAMGCCAPKKERERRCAPQEAFAELAVGEEGKADTVSVEGLW